MKLEFVINNKKYIYEPYILNYPGRETGTIIEGIRVHAYSPRDLLFKAKEALSLPLQFALELSSNPSTTFKVGGTLNGHPITISWVNSLKWYSITATGLQSNRRILIFVDKDISSNTDLGAGYIGYNFYTKTWGYLRGGTGFKPTTDGNVLPCEQEYSEEWFGGVNNPPLDPKDLKANFSYNALYGNDIVPTGTYASYKQVNTQFLDDILMTRFFEELGIKPPNYPDNPDDPEDPDYDPTDPTPGDGDGSSDPIPIPPKPTVDVTGTGFVTLYNPSAIDIRNLAYFMWSGEFVDLIKKMFSAPFDCLIGLKLLYAPVTTGGSQTIWLGNVESSVSAPKITDQFTDFDCGTITLNGYFGSFLDYSPYTKVTIFLPFIGYKELNVDEVMNAQLHLMYRVDAYSGSCVAFLHVTKTIGSTQLNSVLYEFDGNAAMDIPFTSGDMSRYVAAVLNVAASTAVVASSAGKAAVGNIPSADPFSKEVGTQSVQGLSELGNGSLDLLSTKPKIQRSGSLSGANASMAIKTPHIIIERPMQQMPSDYANFIGIPLNMTKTLSQVSGFTVVSQIFMASTTATDDELVMIDTLLRKGVII